MTILEFREDDYDKIIEKAKKVKKMATELIECFEEKKHSEYEDEDEVEYRGSYRRGRMRSGRYGY